MPVLHDVEVRTRSLERFAEMLGEDAMERFRELGRATLASLEGRVVWHVNTTSVGGGVAEMLRWHIGYSRGAGVDSRWVVISGSPEFFQITKRLHHGLHGRAGDGSTLGDAQRAIYEETLRQNADEFVSRLRPGDIVTLHDPQTAGMAPRILRAGAFVDWRCHIGCDVPNEEVERGWQFLRPYLKDVPLLVFSRPAYVPRDLDGDRVRIIPPSIDIHSPKNWPLEEATIRSTLGHIGLVACAPGNAGSYTFRRLDGTPGRVERRAKVTRVDGPPSCETPLVVQISRWDELKDPIGVMHGFAELVKAGAARDAELLLAGPDSSSVSDDPEGASVFEATSQAWRGLPDATRRRVHLALLPTDDVEENAVMVNALQRHAAVVVQKSLEEGFGLTVTEAMWKGRPIVASARGGIRDQIESGISGILLEDPTDLGSFGAAVGSLLEDGSYAHRLGEAAAKRARELYLQTRSYSLQQKVFDELERLVAS